MTEAMTERILLVDYENIQEVDLKALPTDVKVRFVLGGTQGKVPSELAIQAHSVGERFAYVRALSVERNGCDFCIAFYLGEYLTKNPRAECVILSKDKKGFDPLVQHLTAERGYLVRRVGAQKDAFPVAGSAPGSDFDRLTFLLKKEKAHPRKRKGLEGKVKGWFQDLSAGERAALVQRLFNEGFVKETDKLLTFVSARLRGA
jgi:PIN domain